MAAHADPSPTSVHVVQPGDTLSQIALDAGSDTDTIVALNGLGSADVLSVGESVKVPARAAAAAPTSVATSAPTSATSSASSSARSSSSSAASSYTVVSGDTMWAIAQRFSTTTDAIVQLNHLDDADRVIQGTVLSIPSGGQPRAASSTPGSASASTAGSSASSSSNGSGGMTAASVPTSGVSTTSPSGNRSGVVAYTVQPGETLMQIARRFNVAADTIVQATSLSDANKIVVGSVLKVPVAAKAHVVADGETLRDIARSEKVDLGSLIDFNQINDPSLIRVGQIVLLPATAAATASSAATPTPSATPGPASAPATSTAAATPLPIAAPAAAATPSATPTAAASATPSASSTPGASGSAATTPKPSLPSVSAAALASLPSDGLAAAALKFLGSPYIWGGASPKGFDCSGFVWYLAKQLNKQVSRGMLGQYNGGTHPSRTDLKPGDLVFFQNTWAPGLSHNGIYLGDDKFVNAADESTGVTISNLNSAYWSAHWFGATRLT
jgi:cell wall-associated NlpC family hydrolase/nucleoid-associated protein YgaU